MVKNGFWIGALAGGAAVVVVAPAALMPRAWLPTSARGEFARLAAAGLDHLETAFPETGDEESTTVGESSAPVAVASDEFESPMIADLPDSVALGECVQQTATAAAPRMIELASTMTSHPPFSFALSEPSVASSCVAPSCEVPERVFIVLTSNSSERAGVRIIRCEWRSGDHGKPAWNWFDGRSFPQPAGLSG